MIFGVKLNFLVPFWGLKKLGHRYFLVTRGLCHKHGRTPALICDQVENLSNKDPNFQDGTKKRGGGGSPKNTKLHENEILET